MLEVQQEPSRQWSEPRIEALKKLWRDGKSCSVIADIMGNGLTRNAVIGKVHRLKLTTRNGYARLPRPSKSEPKPERRKPSMPALVAMKPLPVVLVEPVPARCTVVEVTGCKWPVDEVNRVHLFCDAPREDHDSYCPFHAAKSVRAKG